MIRARVAIAVWCVAVCLFASSAVAWWQSIQQVAISVAGGGCSQATTYLARTSLAGADITNYTNLICGMVTDGLIDGDLTNGGTKCGTYFDVFYVLATADTTTALQNICQTSFGGTANGSPTFTAYQGYLGVDASTTVYIDTGFNASTASGKFTQNAAHQSAWSNTNATSTGVGGAIIGTTGVAGNPDNSNLPKYVDGSAYFRINDSTASGGTANSNSTGHYLANRSGASASLGIKDGVTFATLNQSSGALININTILLARNQIGVNATLGGGYQIAMASIGADLSSGSPTLACKFFNRLRTYMLAVSLSSAAAC